MNWLRCGLLGAAGVAALWGQRSVGFDLNDRGNAAAERQDYAQAELLYGQALEVWRGMGPAYEAHAAATTLNLGEAYCGEGRWREASKIFQESLGMYRHSLGSKDARTVFNLNVLGNTFLMLGDNSRAEALYNEALLVERELYPNNIQLARSLLGLCSVWSRVGKVAQALPLAEEALSVALKAEGDDGLEAAIMYDNVGRIHRIAGRPERALPLLRKAVFIYEHTLGPTDRRFGSTLSEEGLALMDDRKLTLAERDMVRAVEILTDCGGCQLQLAAAESNLGLLRLRQGKYAEADRVLTHALSMEEAYGEPREFVATTLKTLAEVREKERRYEEAALLKKRADAMGSYR